MIFNLSRENDKSKAYETRWYDLLRYIEINNEHCSYSGLLGIIEPIVW